MISEQRIIELLKKYKKKRIELQQIREIACISNMDTESLYRLIKHLEKENILSCVEASGKTGNRLYPLYNKYKINIRNTIDEQTFNEISELHPLLQKSGYLVKNPDVFFQYRNQIRMLNRYFFSQNTGVAISRKERSYQIFGKEKLFDKNEKNSLYSLITNLKIEQDLNFYDTPEFWFPDYIPYKDEKMVLLICENKDIWFNIRRKMFENGMDSVFGVKINGLIYGMGNKITQNEVTFTHYVEMVGLSEDTKFYYWGDIDKEGLYIYQRFKVLNKHLDISLFVPGYINMINIAKNRDWIEDSESDRQIDVNIDEILLNFDEDYIDYILDIINKNKLIPQEIISYEELG